MKVWKCRTDCGAGCMIITEDYTDDPDNICLLKEAKETGMKAIFVEFE